MIDTNMFKISFLFKFLSSKLSPTHQHYLDVLYVLTQKEVKIRYKRSFLGYLWSILQPLAFAIIFYMAFKVIMRIQAEDYALLLIAGLFPWQWFVNSVNYAPNIFLANASIIKKLNFPRNALVFATVIQDMIHFVLSIPVIVMFLFIYGKAPSLSWLYAIPLLLLIQFIMVCGCALIIGSINLFFRDLERLVAIFTMILFYCTPIIYPVTMIPEQYRKILLYTNPIAPLVVSWRSLFIDGSINIQYVLVAAAYSVIFFVIGYYVYQRLMPKFAEVI